MTREHAFLDDGLVLGAFVQYVAAVRVFTFGVFSHQHDIDIAGDTIPKPAS